MDLRLERSRPRHRRVRVGEDGLAGPHLERERVVVRGDRQHARTLEAHVEEATREHPRDAPHQGDVPLERRLERQDVVPVHEDRLVVELEDRDLLRLIGEIELPLPLGLGELRAFPAHGPLQELAEAVLEDSLAGELDRAEIGDHRPRLGPHVAVEVDLEHALALEFEEPVASVALGARADELGERVATCACLRRIDGREDMSGRRRRRVVHGAKRYAARWQSVIPTRRRSARS